MVTVLFSKIGVWPAAGLKIFVCGPWFKKFAHHCPSVRYNEVLKDEIA